jgi:hypothetical protein
MYSTEVYNSIAIDLLGESVARRLTGGYVPFGPGTFYLGGIKV